MSYKATVQRRRGPVTYALMSKEVRSSGRTVTIYFWDTGSRELPTGYKVVETLRGPDIPDDRLVEMARLMVQRLDDVTPARAARTVAELVWRTRGLSLAQRTELEQRILRQLPA